MCSHLEVQFLTPSFSIREMTNLVVNSRVVKATRTCLQDYTINQHGDVGSLVRMEAIDAVAALLRIPLVNVSDRRDLVALVCGLAVEKLDKVRMRAWYCLQSNWDFLELASKPAL